MRGWLCVLLAGCGPVLLGEERADDAALPAQDATSERLEARLVVSAQGCGCFLLNAEAHGGQGPHLFTWEDRSQGAQRDVCVQGESLEVSVVAEDQSGLRSKPHVTRLMPDDAGCAPPAKLLCVQNPSFEGTAAANLGLPNSFDAPPWSACTNPVVSNTPDIVEEMLIQFVATPVPPVDGRTYLALSEDEQASQPLCEPLQGGDTVALQLDVSRVDLNGTSERLALELWGGVASDCSRRELLWASPTLEVGWKTFCATLRPTQFMDGLTLRATSDKTQLSTAYLLVDHMVPVERCP